MAIKKHPWFQDINWDKLLAGSFEVPAEIASRVQLAFDFLPVDDGYQVFGLQPDEENPPWLDGWWLEAINFSETPSVKETTDFFSILFFWAVL